MGLSGGGGHGKVRGEINVTPLVDVVLVLLIIFLVAMPVLLRDLSLDVPRRADEVLPADPAAADQIVVELKATGMVMLDGTGISQAELPSRLRERLDRKRGDRRVFVGFEDDVIYGDAVSVMDLVKGAGATTVALKLRDEVAPEAATPVAPALQLP